MKLYKFWILPCVLFCLYCLYTLVVDSYEVVYVKRNETNELQYLACVELSRVYPGKTEIDLKALRDELYNHLNRSDGLGTRKNNPKEFEKLVLNRTSSGGYLILNRRVCLIAKDQKELEDIYYFLSFETVLFAMHRDTFNFVRLEHPFHPTNQRIVLKNELVNSDCSKSNSRYRCLNECAKRHFRLARYFYDSNETGLVQLSGSNRTTQEIEGKCFSECKKENCKLVQLTLIDRSRKSKTETFEVQLKLSAFDFWLQLIGLIFSLVSFFFSQFASIAIEFIKSRMRQRQAKTGFYYLNLVILLMNLVYCGYLCGRVTLDHLTEANDLRERETTRNLIQQKIVHLAICVGIRNYVGHTLEKKTMSEIERATDNALDGALEAIYLDYCGRSFRTEYDVRPKILFQDFRRCFPLSMNLNYPMLPFKPKLTIKFKRKVNFFFDLPTVYVLSENEDLNAKSFKLYGEYAFQQRIVKRLRSGGCVDYKEKHMNCSGRQNCVERCIARKFIERYNRTTFGYGQVIDREWFSPSEWNSSQLRRITEDIESVYENIRRECEKEIPDGKECDEIEFKETVQFNRLNVFTKEINLQFDVVRFVEEMPSSLRMALNLLSIQSIFFGFTLLKLFWLVYEFLQPKWRVRQDKFVWFLVCLLCSLGCSWNTIRMLDVIVNGELVPTEHYEVAKQIQMPVVVFCIQIDQSLIDRNHRLTGNYLEKLTRLMNVSSTFESIAYLNESNEWMPFDLNWVERFFLLNMKCFRVNIDQSYHLNQFHFSDDTEVLRINFSEIEHNRLVHFMTQSRETAEFSKIVYLDYSWRPSYSIAHEASLYKYADRFSFFRSHFAYFPEDDLNDLHGQLLELQGNEPDRRTLSLPLTEEHFRLKVDEEYFEHLFSVRMQKNRNKPTNYQQLFVANHLEFESNSKSSFRLTLVFLRGVVHCTNEVNYATLIISLLNLLSIWLELGVLDLRPYLVHFHDYFLVYLYLHLPVYLFRKTTKGILFGHKWVMNLAWRFINFKPNLSCSN